MSTCQNCGAAIEIHYCPYCGQQADVKRIELDSLLEEIPHTFFHINHGFFYNLKNLFLRPGVTIRKYLAGSRKPYFPPIGFLAVLLLFNYLSVKITNLHYYDEHELLTMSPKEAELIKKYDATQWWFLEHTYLYMLIAIPVCTVFCFFFFRIFGRKFNFFETAVILMFILAEGVFMQSVIYFATGWVRNGFFIRTVESINVVLLLLYAAYGLYAVANPVKHKVASALLCIAGGTIVLALMIASAYWLLGLSNFKA